ncbi:MAG: hypothetical protein U0R17_06440, partial [Acidimicrobiia bacterium]
MSVFDLNRFVPEYLQNIELYDPERKPVLYDLSDNTSQWGMSDAVKQSLFSGLSKDNNYLSRYPDIYASEVKEELGKYYSRYVG